MVFGCYTKIFYEYLLLFIYKLINLLLFYLFLFLFIKALKYFFTACFEQFNG